MAKKTESVRIRDLPKETQREIERRRAQLALEKVKMNDARDRIEEHRAEIDKLKGT